MVEFTYHDMTDDDMSSLSMDRDLPILAGIEARVATRQSSCTCQLTAKTAVHLEAARALHRPPTILKDHSSLGSPQEGRSKIRTPMKTSRKSNTTSDEEVVKGVKVPMSQNDMNDKSPDAISMSDEDLEVTLLTHQSLGVDLLMELCRKYGNDPFFQSILERPKEFQNFKLKSI